MKVIYIRTSTKEQNPKIQLRDIYKQWEELQGNSEIYQDKQSAWKDTAYRESFEKIREGIQAKNISDIYVWDWDRLFRNRERLQEFFRFCKEHGCLIHSVRQHFAESIMNMDDNFREPLLDMLISMLGWLSEEESTKKSERVKNAVVDDGFKRTSFRKNKWGDKLRDLEGNMVEVPFETIDSMYKDIVKLIDKGRKYALIQKHIAKKYSIAISLMYITRVKKHELDKETTRKRKKDGHKDNKKEESKQV